jgi:hypothetical protein
MALKASFRSWLTLLTSRRETETGKSRNVSSARNL